MLVRVNLVQARQQLSPLPWELLVFGLSTGEATLRHHASQPRQSALPFSSPCRPTAASPRPRSSPAPLPLGSLHGTSAPRPPSPPALVSPRQMFPPRRPRRSVGRRGRHVGHVGGLQVAAGKGPGGAALRVWGGLRCPCAFLLCLWGRDPPTWGRRVVVPCVSPWRGSGNRPELRTEITWLAVRLCMGRPFQALLHRYKEWKITLEKKKGKDEFSSPGAKK